MDKDGYNNTQEAYERGFIDGMQHQMQSSVDKAVNGMTREQDRQIDQLIQERDHRDEIIDKLCDAVLGPDRYEWSSQYFFEDAVREVEERMAALEAQPEQEPVAVARVDDLERGGRVRALAMGLALDAPLYTSPPAQQEPDRVKFERHWRKTRGEKKANRELPRHPLQPQTYIQDSANRHWVTWQAAVRSVAPPAQRKPLTDEEIDKLPWEPHESNPMTFAEGLRYFARAIEAAHGIKE